MKSLQNISYKTLFTILFLSLAGIVFFIRIGGKTQKVSAAWWDEMWHYRKAISIENSSGSNLTDFQVSISVGTSQLIAEGKMQTDCDDIRITDINGNLLPYWIETGTCNTNTTKILSRINSLPTSGSIVYIYYGNSTVVSATDATAVPQTCSKVNSYFGTNFYYINPEGKKNSIPVQAYCDMTTDGGGWTLVASWDTSQEWTKSSNSISDVFGTTPKNTVSSNFGNAPTNDFRILASDTITSVGTSAYADWYYHYNANTSWKEVWAPSANTGGNIESTYRSPSPRQAIQPFNYSYNIKFSYQVTQTWNNLSDWSLNVSSFDLPNYWLALTSPGNKFGVYSAVSGSGSNDGSLGICPSGSNNCITGQDMGSNQSKVGYDDNIPSASFGATATSNVGGNPPVDVTTKLWWFIRDGTPINKSYSVGYTSTEETGTGPIAYWKFDEGSGTTAYDSVSSNNGTLSGTTIPEWQTEENCISGKCLSFNGTNNYIQLTTVNNIKSISMWVYIPSGQTQNRYLLDARTGLSGGWLYNGSTGGNWIKMYINGIQQSNTSFNKLPTDQWFHLYMESNTIFSDDISLMSRYGNSEFLAGKLDEVKLYGYARTPDQIKQDYNSRGSLSGAGVNLGVRSNTAPSLKSSLIAHYKFDEGNSTTTNDSSPQKKSGSLVGTTLPSWSNNCKYGKCINFISTNANKISTNTIYNNSSEYTISAFIYPTSAGGNQYRIILGSAMGNNIDSGLVLPPGGSLNICYHNYMGSGDTNYCSTNNPITLNQWQHVALTFKNNNVNIFHNGINVKNVSIGKTSSSNYTVIGGASSYDYNGDRFFNGLIDEVKIYNRALTPEEIKQDYNAGSAIQFGSISQSIGGTTTSLEYCIPGDTSFCAPPVAEWKFEENTGTTAKDTSGNNNNGTFGTGNSTPTWSLGKNNIGAGLSFDGVNDYAISTNIPITQEMTWQIWYKANIPQGEFLIDHRSSETGVQPVYIYSDGRIQFYDSIYGSYTTSSGVFKFDNNWHHVAVTGTATSKVVYFDGINIGSTNAGITPQTARAIYLGTRHTLSSFFNGKIDDVKIYSYARTPAQIAYDYNRGAPVGWWKLDECQGSTAFDSSGLGNTGVISIGQSGTQTTLGTCQTGTSAAWTNGASGKINSSLNFDGTDDKITINDPGANSSLDANGKNITLSAWVKGNSFTSQYNAIMIKQTVAPYEMWAYYDDLMCGFIIDGTSYRKTYTANFSPGVWYHVTCSYDGSNIKAYVNGTLKQSWTQTGNTITDNNNSLYLGWSGYSTEYFNGQIDDVRIYNYALTSEQVKQVYNGGAVNFQ